MNNIPEQHDATVPPEITETLKRFALFDQPFSTVLQTSRGPLDLRKECVQQFHNALAYCFSGSLKLVEIKEPDDDTRTPKAIVDINRDDERYFNATNAELLDLARQYVAANMARILARKDQQKELNQLFTEMLEKFVYFFKTALKKVDNLDLQKDGIGALSFAQYCYKPFLYQLEHMLFYEWCIRGGDISKLPANRVRFVATNYLTPPPPGANLPKYFMETQYRGMVRSLLRFKDDIAPLITEEDRQMEMETQEAFETTLRAKKAPYQGYVAQEIALKRLEKQKELEERFREACLLISKISGSGILLPDVTFEVEDNGISYGIELTNEVTKRARMVTGDNGVTPLLRIFRKADTQRKINMLEAEKNEEMGFVAEDNAFYLHGTGWNDLVPSETMKGMYFTQVLLIQAPHISMIDLARAFPGGLAWAERVFVPAVEKIAEMYLDTEQFENSPNLLPALVPDLPSAVDMELPEEPRLPPEAWEEPEEEEEIEPAVHAEPSGHVTEFGSLLYDHDTESIYYLRPSVENLAASDRNRDLYKKLTGKSLPKNMVLREIPYQRSGMKWREVEDVLIDFFDIKVDRQKGSHMMYKRDIPGLPRMPQATIMAHYTDSAKRKTLASVLRTLRIPAPLFWITVSRTYKATSVKVGDILGLSEEFAKEVKDRV